MSEKVLGFYKKDAAKELASYKTNCKKIVEKNYVYDIRKSQLVPVRLASESVGLEWLKKYVKHIRSCFEKNQLSDFEAGEETGRIEGLEVLLAEAKKEAKNQAVEKK